MVNYCFSKTIIFDPTKFFYLSAADSQPHKRWDHSLIELGEFWVGKGPFYKRT